MDTSEWFEITIWSIKAKSMIRRLILMWTVVCLAGTFYGQSAHELLMEGDDLYRKEQFDKSEEKYRKAKVNDKSGKAAFNLGNSLAKQERYEEAANQFSNAAALSQDSEVKAKALYNLGNAHFRNQKYQESIEAYQSALKINEDDEQTRQNLSLAKYMKKMLEKQQQQQQQQQQEQENQENQEQQQQQQQEQQNQEEQQQQAQEQEEEKEQQSAEEKKDLDKEDARKLLEIIENEEKKVQEKLRKMKGNSSKPKKDW